MISIQKQPLCTCNEYGERQRARLIHKARREKYKLKNLNHFEMCDVKMNFKRGCLPTSMVGIERMGVRWMGATEERTTWYTWHSYKG